MAVKCVAIWFLNKMWQGKYLQSQDQIVVLLARLPFGSFTAPAEFCIASETVFDLANDLLYCKHWDPVKLPSPYANELPNPEQLSPDIPFWQAKAAGVTLDPTITGGVEGYIDDGACAVLDSPQPTYPWSSEQHKQW